MSSLSLCLQRAAAGPKADLILQVCEQSQVQHGSEREEDREGKERRGENGKRERICKRMSKRKMSGREEK